MPVLGTPFSSHLLHFFFICFSQKRPATIAALIARRRPAVMEVKMKKSLSDKMMTVQKQRSMSNGNNKKSGRFLITVNVFGSAGPIRFVVNEDDKVAGVIDMALRQYAREGRLPVLGSHAGDFFLYPASSGFEALSASTSIGNSGARNFMLCKKQRQPLMTEGRPQITGLKGTRSWKSWLTKSFFHKIILTE